MSTAQAGAAAAAPTESGLLGAGLLDRIVEESRIAQSEQEKSRARDIIGEPAITQSPQFLQAGRIGDDGRACVEDMTLPFQDIGATTRSVRGGLWTK